MIKLVRAILQNIKRTESSKGATRRYCVKETRAGSIFVFYYSDGTQETVTLKGAA